MKKLNVTREQLADLRKFLAAPTEPPQSRPYTSARAVLTELSKELRALSRAGYSAEQIAGFFTSRGIEITPRVIAQAIASRAKKMRLEPVHSAQSTDTEQHGGSQ